MWRYRLTIFFIITSVVVIGLAAATSNRLIGTRVQRELVLVAEETVSQEAQHFISMLRHEFTHPAAGLEGEGRSTMTLESLAGPEGLPGHYSTLVMGLDVVRIRLLGLDGRVLWSSDRELAGVVQEDSRLYSQARRGESVSVFAPDRELRDASGTVHRRDMVETYVPLRGTPEGQIIGVLDIFWDVTQEVAPPGPGRQSRHPLDHPGHHGGPLCSAHGVCGGDGHRSLRRCQRLQESEQKYRRLFEESKDAIFITSRDGYFIDVNPAALELFDYNRDELMSMDPEELWVSPDDRANFRQELDEKSFVRDYVVRSYQKDGSLQHSLLTMTAQRDDSGRIVATQGIVRDITEIRRIVEALENSDARHLRLFEQSRDAIVISSREGDTRMMEVNQAFVDLFGYSREEASELDLQNLWVEPGAREAFLEEQEAHNGATEVEVRYRRKDGAEMDCLLTTRVWRNEEGSIAGAQAIIRDITQRKRAEEGLRAREAEAIRLNMLQEAEAKGLAYLQESRRRIIQAQEGLRKSIAEELHGPVQTRLFLLQRRLRNAASSLQASPADAEWEVQEVAEELDDLRENQIRRVSHRLHPSIIAVGLVAGLRSLRDSLETTISTELKVSPEVAAMEGAGTSDIPEIIRLGLYRVAEETLANVIKHSHASQTVIRLGVGEGDGRLVLTIADNGVGFSLEETPVRGLGFTTIEDYLGAMGGAYTLETAPGQGTRITVTIPLNHA